MKILLVDDNPQERKFLRVFFEREGWMVAEAGNGNDGLRTAEEFGPDVIISDGMMPDMDGYNFLREIRKSGMKDIFFIFYSAVYTGQIEEELALSLGADAFIQKPKPPRDLIQQIKELTLNRTKPRKEASLLGDEMEYLKKYSSVLQANVEKKTAELSEYKSRTEAEIGKLKIEAGESGREAAPEPPEVKASPHLQNMPPELWDRGYVSRNLNEPLERIRNICNWITGMFEPLLKGEGEIYTRQILSATQRLEKLLEDMLFIPMVRKFEVDDLIKRIRVFIKIMDREYAVKEPSGKLDVKIKELSSIVLFMEKTGKDMLDIIEAAGAPFHPEPVDLSRIASVIAERLKLSQMDRKAEFAIEEGIRSVGDPELLRLMMANLLENAWKFTGKKAQARIEFGRKGDGIPSFFVRDNGAGFDMARYHELFKSFSRLHSQDDFPGSGLGLALVKMIVERHNGRISATGETGNGATFSFSLPGSG